MDEEQKLKLTLTIKDWNKIRTAMGKASYKSIAYLFDEMDNQFNAQLEPPMKNTEEGEMYGVL